VRWKRVGRRGWRQQNGARRGNSNNNSSSNSKDGFRFLLTMVINNELHKT
jgi:hypothetical protein